ncbi:hypothetical protein [Oceanisphaera sp. IT1-181]|uniref:hypothetical protein n=1 Tax=Oceanisphaera sp. IT1-181 TaxID=3081199 RepID=UPI0029C9DE13|nr:hypothetical protein [Oceanisphaera sp. IT1-181]
MLKTTSLLIIAATSLLSAQAAFASTEPASTATTSTGVCFNVMSQGTDGVDRFQAKMAKLQAERAGISTADCVPAKIYLNVGSNGTEGVDHFQEKFVSLQLEDNAHATPATVSLNMASNGTDGVDRFDSRMRQLATQ